MSTRRPPIHQLVHTLSYGDAISGEVLALQKCFRAQAIESEIFALNIHPTYKGQAQLVTAFRSNEDLVPGTKVLLHYSLGSPLNDRYRALTKAERILVYHNLTPPHWFAGVNPRIVADIVRGQKELPELCAVSDSIVADSNYNAGEIKALGFNAVVLPLPIDQSKWNVARNEGIYSIVKSEPGIHLVHVGRLAPNKCVEDIIKVFYFIRQHPNIVSRLWLVGIDIDTELYSFSLRRLAHDLGIDEHINFVGCLADAEVRALYEAGTVYLCMSEHEGFCLPVIEAMSFGLPVIAYASTAVPETVGCGGILVKEKRHAEIAELVLEVARNSEMRNTLATAGRARAAELSYEKFADKVTALFSLSLSTSVTEEQAVLCG